MKGEQASGVGAIRQCDLMGGGHIVEKVIDWKDGESYTIEVTETSLPLKRARTTLSVAPTDVNASRVTMTIDYTPTYGPIGLLVDLLMMRSAVRGQMIGILAGLSTYVSGSDSEPELGDRPVLNVPD